MTAPLNPECAAGKHRNCWGDTLDENDNEALCPCACHKPIPLVADIETELLLRNPDPRETPALAEAPAERVTPDDFPGTDRERITAAVRHGRVTAQPVYLNRVYDLGEPLVTPPVNTDDSPGPAPVRHPTVDETWTCAWDAPEDDPYPAPRFERITIDPVPQRPSDEYTLGYGIERDVTAQRVTFTPSPAEAYGYGVEYGHGNPTPVRPLTRLQRLRRKTREARYRIRAAWHIIRHGEDDYR